MTYTVWCICVIYWKWWVGWWKCDQEQMKDSLNGGRSWCRTTADIINPMRYIQYIYCDIFERSCDIFCGVFLVLQTRPQIWLTIKVSRSSFVVHGHNVMRNKGWRVNVQSIKCVVVLHLGLNLVTLSHLFTFRGQTAGFGTILVPTLLIKRLSQSPHAFQDVEMPPVHFLL